MEQKNLERLGKAGLYLCAVVVLFYATSTPFVTEQSTGEIIQQAHAPEFVRQEFAPSLSPLAAPTVISELTVFHGLYNALFLVTLILMLALVIPLLFIVGTGVAGFGVVSNSMGDAVAGCLLAVASPLAALGPIVCWLFLLIQPGGTVAYYLIMLVSAVPAFTAYVTIPPYVAGLIRSF